MTTMSNRFNKYKYPGAKRLMLEAQELRDNTEDYCAQPVDDNLFEWHFTLRGPPDTAFDGGFYHGMLSFPTEYPMKPPSIILLTPNGRFETNKKICLSISGYHPETWQPSWSVRTALLALIAFMPTKTNRAIGSLDFSDSERRKLALKSRTWRCETCGPIKNLLKHPKEASGNISNDQSEASASRVGDKERKNFTSDRSDSDVEDRDSSSDSQAASSINLDPEDRNTALLKRPNLTRDCSSKSITRRRNNSVSPLNSTRGLVEEASNATQGSSQDIQIETKRPYLSLVFISIFILLALLILRRVVMVIQA